MKSAIYWLILPPQIKNNIKKYLTNEEQEKLEVIINNYKNLEKSHKIKIQKDFYKFFFVYHFPIEKIYIFLLILFIFLFFIYIFLYKPKPLFLFEIFWPFFLGVMSFAAYRFLEPYQFNYYFRLPGNAYIYLYSLVVSYLLMFVLMLINKENVYNLTKLRFIEKFILSIGVFLAPFSEELIFRHVIPDFLGKGFFKNIVGHLLSNILFSILHFPSSWEQGSLYFFSGMFLSFLKIFSNNLLICIMAHSLANLLYFLFF